jgi:hypothetical protein
MKIDLNIKVDVTSKLSREQARKVLAEIFHADLCLVSFSRHCREQMVLRDLTTGDIVNVLKAGKITQDPEEEH